MKTIKFNINDFKSIKRAERTKAMYENKGYTFIRDIVNSFTGECSLIYQIN